jgi:PSP1 C-terminal conserved region
LSEPAYLIRYGVMGYVARFRASPECGGSLERGQAAVIQTDRGIELGEVLAVLDEPDLAPPLDQQSVLRPADPEDLARSRHAESIRSDRFALCQRVLREGDWPWELIDVEPMLDDRATVLHYLGPHRLDAAILRARFRMTCEFDIVLEPVGIDADAEDVAWDDEPHGDHDHGGCGDCGAGGCGSRSAREQGGSERAGASTSGATGCGTSPHSGCASCGISRLRAARDVRKTAAES